MVWILKCILSTLRVFVFIRVCLGISWKRVLSGNYQAKPFYEHTYRLFFKKLISVDVLTIFFVVVKIYTLASLIL